MFFLDTGEGKFSVTADVCGVESLTVCCLSHIGENENCREEKETQQNLL